MGDIINSKDQSGGITAHTVNMKNKTKLVAAISMIIGIAVGIKTLFFSKENPTMKDETKIGSQEQSGGITARDVADNSKIIIRGNQGPVQFTQNSPGSSQIVNQKRLISPTARMERSMRGSDHLLRVTLTQLPGFWDEGTKFELGFKASGPYKEAKIVSGLPGVQTDVRFSENKGEGVYVYSMRSAPLPDTPIILEVLSEIEINMEQFSVAPIAQ